MKSVVSFGLIAVVLWVSGCERRFVPYVDAGDGGNVDGSQSDQQTDIQTDKKRPDAISMDQNTSDSTSLDQNTDDGTSLDQNTDDGIPLDQNTDVAALKKKNGELCKSGSECTNTHCVEGVCCDGPCNGACKSCKVSGKVGQCSNVPSGQDPKKNCVGKNASCSGSCNGNGACTYPGSSKSCGNDACSGQGKLTTYQCDGQGGCKTTTTNVGWAISVPGHVYAISSLSSGATVVSGYLEEPPTFKTIKGEITLTGSDLYVAKIDSSGNFLWATAPKGGATIRDLHIDSSGNSYIVGDFYFNDVTFGNKTLLYEGRNSQGFIAKLDSTGNFVWAEKFGGADCFLDHEKAVGVDAKGNVYIAGIFMGTATIGGKTYTSYKNSRDVFLTKYKPDRTALWTKTMEGSGEEYVRDIVLDSSGNVYMIGESDSTTVTFEGKSANTAGRDDVFVAKVSPDGYAFWLLNAGGADYDDGERIAIDNKGDLYISGHHTSGTFGTISLKGSDYFIAKLSGTRGDFLWARNTGDVTVSNVVAGIDGYLYTSGTFIGTKTFGSSTYTSKGSSHEAYIAKVSPSDGKYIKAAASSGGATPKDLSGISSGYLFSAGRFYDGATVLGTFSITKGPGYVWNLRCSSVFP